MIRTAANCRNVKSTSLSAAVRYYLIAVETG
jgi:hypothetical protein